MHLNQGNEQDLRWREGSCAFLKTALRTLAISLVVNRTDRHADRQTNRQTGQGGNFCAQQVQRQQYLLRSGLSLSIVFTRPVWRSPVSPPVAVRDSVWADAWKTFARVSGHWWATIQRVTLPAVWCLSTRLCRLHLASALPLFRCSHVSSSSFSVLARCSTLLYPSLSLSPRGACAWVQSDITSGFPPLHSSSLILLMQLNYTRDVILWHLITWY